MIVACIAEDFPADATDGFPPEDRKRCLQASLAQKQVATVVDVGRFLAILLLDCDALKETQIALAALLRIGEWGMRQFDQDYEERHSGYLRSRRRSRDGYEIPFPKM